jgi:hypothetical protein
LAADPWPVSEPVAERHIRQAAGALAVQLQRVYYELYESDLQVLESRAWAVPQELEGQVRLEFFDTSAIYVSAIQCRDGFCAHYRGASHFANPLPFEREVSDHPLWTPLIASSINLAVIDDLRQVIAIRSPTRCVYCCSCEAGAWEADRLTICRSLPRPAAA